MVREPQLAVAVKSSPATGVPLCCQEMKGPYVDVPVLTSEGVQTPEVHGSLCSFSVKAHSGGSLVVAAQSGVAHLKIWRVRL